MQTQGIATTLRLVDQMTAPIMAIQHAISGLETRFNDLGAGAIDSSSFAAMQNQIEMSDAATRVLADNMNLVHDAVENLTPGQNNFNNAVQQGNSMMDGLTKKIMGAVAAYASIQGVKKVFGISDELTQTTARLNMMNDGL